MTATLTPALALDYVRSLSADVRAAVILDAHGERLAGSPQLEHAARTLLDDDDGPALEGRTSSGAVFAARDPHHAIVVVTGPHALSRLTLRDLRSALSALGGETAREAPPERVPEAAVGGLLRAISAP